MKKIIVLIFILSISTNVFAYTDQGTTTMAAFTCSGNGHISGTLSASEFTAESGLETEVPTADSSDNIYSSDVIGNKSDTSDGTSLIAYNKRILNRTQHLQSFGGNIFYISPYGSDSDDGEHPEEPFLTFAHAWTAMTNGDALTIRAGDYTETGIDLALDDAELWFEIGAILKPATGTPLTISGNYCKVQCPGGSLRIDPAANETGVEVTGNWAYLHDIRVPCASTADIGFDITGDGCVLTNCRCSAPLVSAFKIQGDKTKLEDCCTGGNSGDSSIGFWMASGDKTRLKNCGSQGHETAGFQVDTSPTNGVIENCYSGGGDGKWTDADSEFVWSKFSYDNNLYATSTLTADGGVGGTGTVYNLFKVTGAIRVFNIIGHVTTEVQDPGATTLNLELGATAQVDITAGGGDIGGAPVGTTFVRNSVAGDAMVITFPASTPVVLENSNWRDPNTPITLVAENGTDTYIELHLGDNPTSGAIHWHIDWEPVTDDGFIESVP